ncbi:MAG: tellurite resistance TerB family protein [Paracoccus sp. (in: a-proteobacteria)]|uniref:tellurite resistance TerB family protein n=1 Tax=Paracoccus sp. TaxID=267 RepID=UPI0039193208
MSLVKSLAKVAAGVMLAKGLGAAMRGQQGSDTANGQPRRGGMLDGLLGNNSGGGGTSLSDLIGRTFGGGTAGGPSQGTGQGLAGLLDGLKGTAAGGALGGLLGGASGRLAQKDAQPRNDAGLGELLDDAARRNGEPEIAPTPQQNAVAGLMLRAMIQAAKADGHIDATEKQRLMDHLGNELDPDERDFVREQMAAPVDAQALARDVPPGLETQVYLMSVLAIDFDDEAEARYLRDLAQALKLSPQAVNALHERLGAAPLHP